MSPWCIQDHLQKVTCLTCLEHMKVPSHSFKIRGKSQSLDTLWRQSELHGKSKGALPHVPGALEVGYPDSYEIRGKTKYLDGFGPPRSNRGAPTCLRVLSYLSSQTLTPTPSILEVQRIQLVLGVPVTSSFHYDVVTPSYHLTPSDGNLPSFGVNLVVTCSSARSIFIPQQD